MNVSHDLEHIKTLEKEEGLRGEGGEKKVRRGRRREREGIGGNGRKKEGKEEGEGAVRRREREGMEGNGRKNKERGRDGR